MSIIRIIRIIDIMHLINFNEHNLFYLFGLGLRFESHTPENVVDQMNDILVQHENLLHASSLNSFDRVAVIKMQLVKHMLVEDGSDNTYRSTFASSSSSSVLS